MNTKKTVQFILIIFLLLLSLIFHIHFAFFLKNLLTLRTRYKLLSRNSISQVGKKKNSSIYINNIFTFIEFNIL